MFRLLLVLLLLFVFPPWAIAAGVVPFSFRTPLLLLMFLCAVLYSFTRGLTSVELGIRRDNLVASLRINFLVSLGFLALLSVLYYCGCIAGPFYSVWGTFVPFYLFLSAPIQEFLFRGFLLAEMRASGIERGWVFVLVSALSFSFIHIIYGDWLTMLVTFLGGLVWGVVYYRVPNLAGVSLSHALFGLLALLGGLARKL